VRLVKRVSVLSGEAYKAGHHHGAASGHMAGPIDLQLQASVQGALHNHRNHLLMLTGAQTRHLQDAALHGMTFCTVTAADRLPLLISTWLDLQLICCWSSLPVSECCHSR